MGVIKRGILGGFSNKVGNVVGSTWKGIAVVKSMPLSVANPKTAGQVKQRTFFKEMTTLASAVLSPIIKPLWDRFASNMSGYNSFISTNRIAINASGNIEHTKLQFGKGRMLAPTIGTVSSSGTNKTFPLTNPTACKYGLPSDKIYVVCMDRTTNDVYYSGITSTSRGSGSTASATVTLGNGFVAGGSCDCFAGYVRADGSEVSGSAYKVG